MKALLLTLSIYVCLSIHAQAQWTNDPENPYQVCDVTCVQSAVQHVADGSGGAFVFWLDSRVGCNGNTYNDIYGQHYDENGYELWESGGREILSYPNTIERFAFVRTQSDNEMIAGAMVSGIGAESDSLWFQKIDDDGMKLWANDLLVAKSDGCTGNYFLGFESFSFLRDDSGYVVNFTPTYCGGSDGNRITRFSSNGVLTGPFNGEPEGNQYYIGARGIDRTYDGTNDVYLYYTDGNGAGAHARCMRVTIDGDSAWAPIDVLEGTNGLNYQYAAMSDEDGIAVCFQSNGAGNTVDLFMRKLNGDGTWAWNANTTNVCTADGQQGNFFWVQDQNFYYICWADGRPGVVGNYAVYAQKVDKATGEIVWAENGIQVLDQNTYLPYPKCVLRSDGKLIVTNESTDPLYGLNAQALNQEGTLAWNSPSVLANSSNLPFYADYGIIESGNNILVAWSKSFSGGGADGIYMANAQTPMTQVSETISACNSYLSNGETFTQSGTYIQELPGDTLLTLNLTITNVLASTTLNGNTLTANNTEGNFSWINCTTNTTEASGSGTFTPTITGEYALVVELNSCADTSDCQLITVIGVEELTFANQISVFPNPGSDFLNMSALSPLHNAELRLYNQYGQLIRKVSGINGSQFFMNTEDLNAGIYWVMIFERNRVSTNCWVKE
jgi:Secretion system C-terminal sorting domain